MVPKELNDRILLTKVVGFLVESRLRADSILDPTNRILCSYFYLRFVSNRPTSVVIVCSGIYFYLPTKRIT